MPKITEDGMELICKTLMLEVWYSPQRDSIGIRYQKILYSKYKEDYWNGSLGLALSIAIFGGGKFVSDYIEEDEIKRALIEWNGRRNLNEAVETNERKEI